MSNGGRIYKHAIKQVVVGLIPLKLHPAAFGRKETWLRSKGTILNDIFQVIYVLKMIYQVCKKQCPTALPSGISWAFDSPPLHPSGISNFLRGGSLDILWNHTMKESPHLLFFYKIFF